MMKRILLVILLVYSFSLTAQELSTVLTGSFPLQCDQFIGVDEFQSQYYINDNILYKKTAKKVFSYSNINLGKLQQVNIQNPFKVILFYEDFNAAILLDNNLNELTDRIDFTQETKFNNVSFVTGASMNNIWLFADDNKLHLYDYQQKKELLQTQPTTFYDSDFEARNIVSTYKNVWILSKKGVLEFNEYGVYTRAYRLEDTDQILPFQKGFIYLTQDNFFYNDLTETIPIAMDAQPALKKVYANNSNLFIYDGKQVFQYQIKR